MATLKLRWCALVAVAAVVAACSSGRSEGMKSEPPDFAVRPVPQDSGTPGESQHAPSSPPRPRIRPDAGASTCASCGPNDQCVDGRCVCQPRTCLSYRQRCGQFSDGCGGVIDCGRCSRCGPDEMDCCGTCIPRAEGRCPDNVHCPTPLPEM